MKTNKLIGPMARNVHENVAVYGVIMCYFTHEAIVWFGFLPTKVGENREIQREPPQINKSRGALIQWISSSIHRIVVGSFGTKTPENYHQLKYLLG